MKSRPVALVMEYHCLWGPC